MTRRTSLPVVFALLAACGGSATQTTAPATTPGETEPGEVADAPAELDEPTPLGKLPEGVTPLHYELALQIVPSEDRFSGQADIRVRLDEARDLIWLHGRDLNVSTVTVTPADGEPVEGEWRLMDEEGVVGLVLPEEIPAGEATIHVAYDAPFNRHLTGLYRVDTGGDSYAFTQFQAISARRAFPSFDEPRFKTRFDVTLTGKEDHVLAGNTLPVEEEELDGGMKRVELATTEPLPTYLLAWAVGPLDVVEAEAIPANDIREEPVPLRGLAVKGKGEQLAYALENTPAQLVWLEEYFGAPYPYDKIDIVAVPDFAAGAMENVGLITFREWLLLVDPETAGENQKRAFAYVMAHELAHMWFGNLVTMPWWDDIWLNEAFATWMGHKVVENINEDYNAEIAQLERVLGAMRNDSLSTARQIRQPIESSHDISNAFDSITYSKGGGVLEMFERWIGEDTFRDAMRAHVQQHRHGVADADDLLASLDEATEKDVTEPFRSFLFQPGVPFLDAKVSCEGDTRQLVMEQSRYLPVGSPGEAEQTWKVPVCARYQVGREVKTTCTLLEDGEGSLDFEGNRCPTWVMPNADASGYYRFSLPEEDLEKLRERGWRRLSAREKIAVADSLRAAFNSAATDAAEVYGALPSLAREDIRAVASKPFALVDFALDYVTDDDLDPRVQGYARRMYQPLYRKLRFEPRRGRQEDGETKLLREEVIAFLAMTAEDPGVREEAAERGRAYVEGGEIHADAVEPNLAGTALTVAVQEGDAELFDQLTEMLFASEDATVRSRILSALAKAKDPELAGRARALALDARLRTNEVFTPLWSQASSPETRGDIWRWVQENYDALVERVSRHRGGYLPWITAGFCTEARANEVERFFADRIEDLPGGPRNLASALEAIRLCAARVEAQSESTRSFFEDQRP